MFMHWHPSQGFLTRVSEEVMIYNGRVINRQAGVDRTQTTLAFGQEQNLSFVKPIDVVFESECTRHGVTDEEIDDLDHFLRKFDVKSVLLICGCCGAYGAEDIEKIRKQLPNVEWVIPEVRDFCDNLWGSVNHHVGWLVIKLIEDGVLAIQ